MRLYYVSINFYIDQKVQCQYLYKVMAESEPVAHQKVKQDIIEQEREHWDSEFLSDEDDAFEPEMVDFVEQDDRKNYFGTYYRFERTWTEDSMVDLTE